MGLPIVVATLTSYVLARAIGIPAFVPILNVAASFPFMLAALRRGDLRGAIVRMLIWAATMGVCATAWSYLQPAATDVLFLRGESYRSEMFEWVRTGIGAESDPSRFIPQHAGHALVFAVAALATGGLAAMAMGAALMNYMGHYVGALAASSAHPAATAALGWHPWAVIRIVSFVTMGVILSAPLLSRLLGFRFNWRAARPLIGYAAIGLVADIVLKWILAPTWQRLLLRTTGW